MNRLRGFSSVSGWSGRHKSELVGNRMPSGMMPMIVWPTSLILSARPITAGSLPYRFFQML